MKLILVRGIPGSGKTSFAYRQFPGVFHVENDMFLMHDGKYCWSKDIVKQALRWGLAIFGIRSAYNFLRSSISTISQYNEQVATDIEKNLDDISKSIEVVISILSPAGILSPT